MTVYGTAPSYYFTSEEEIVRLVSLSGTNQWLDDLAIADTEDFFLEVISDATLTCMQYLTKLYDIADLANSRWVRRRATYIAAYFLSKRRGDPGIYGEDYNRALLELQEASEGVIQIPELPFSVGMLAVMQSPVIDMRYLHNKIRIRQTSSTDVSGREYLMSPIPYDWL